MSVDVNTKPVGMLGGIGLRGWVMAAVLVMMALVPFLVEVTGNAFYLDLGTRLICLAIAAVSLNLILGYGGMISFGHAAYIGIGAYCVGIPAYYEYTSGFLQIPLAVVVSALFALVTGALCLRTKGVYFIMITMAFSQMVFFLFVSLDEYGADDGLTIDYRSEFGGLIDVEDNVTLYYVCFVSLLASIYLVYRIVNSRFGMAIRGARGNESRMRAIGYNTYVYRLTCYVISGAMCGFAGALLGNFTSFISPEMMDWTRSGELMFMVIVGGAGSLFGPVLGAIAFVLFENWLSEIWIHWRLIFGIILILTVLFVKGGIDGFLKSLEERWRG